MTSRTTGIMNNVSPDLPDPKALADLTNQGHFARLEAVGEIKLNDHLRSSLAASISCHSHFNKFRRGKPQVFQVRKKASLLTDKTIGELEVLYKCCPTAFDPSAVSSLLSTLQEFSANVRPPKRKAGNAYRWEDDGIIVDAARVFWSAGGEVANYTRGPWVPFLEAIWELLATDARPGKDALIKRAERLQKQLAQNFPHNKADSDDRRAAITSGSFDLIELGRRLGGKNVVFHLGSSRKPT